MFPEGTDYLKFARATTCGQLGAFSSANCVWDILRPLLCVGQHLQETTGFQDSRLSAEQYFDRRQPQGQ